MKANGFIPLMNSMLKCVRSIGQVLRDGEVSHEKTGGSNSFGDHQLEVDVHVDEIIFERYRDMSTTCAGMRIYHYDFYNIV